MRLQLTVSTPGPGGAPMTHEVEVEAAIGRTAAELTAALSSHLDAPGAVLSSRQRVVAGEVLLGTPPLVDGAALTLGPPPAPRRTGRPRTPVQVRVVHGPDAGRVLELTPGTHTLGRSPEADVCLADPRLSRVHARLLVTTDGVHVADLGSTNGTHLDGERVGGSPRRVRADALVRVGSTSLQLGAPTEVPATTAARSDGTTAVNRRPRVLDPPAPTAIALPAPPQEPRRTRVPWAAMLLPIPFAAVMAVFFGPLMLAFAVMGPVVMAGTALGDRFGSRRRYAVESAEYARRLAEARARVAQAATAESDGLRRAHPDPAAVLAAACGPTSRLWERQRHDPDALLVAVGTCDRPSTTRVIRPPGDAGPEHVSLEGVPCVVPWPRVGTLGVCGARADVLGAARSVLGQVVTAHSPADVQLVLLTCEERVDDWAWLLRLPHSRGEDGGLRAGALAVGPVEAAGVVERLGGPRAGPQARPAAGAEGQEPWTVLVVDGTRLEDVPGLAEVLADGGTAGVLGLALADRHGALPAACGAVLDLEPPAVPRLVLAGSTHERLAVDRVGGWWADRLSRGLAPLRDATPASCGRALPERLGLAAALGWTVTDARALADRWTEVPACTAVPVGAGPDGPMVLDLAADGPHVLVGGTTGAGKSELLRTLVASLALHHRPDRLSFVLVDYKGGAAFRECAGLPHVSGVVTDLDEHLADRALVSLTAELKRRERVLRAVGVPDFAAYQRHPASQRESLARLVVVVDEFRALADELPAFVDGMVRFAALGRSLGVHVVLATQRPAGVVTADIKANVNLRIALRVRDPAESDDIVGTPDAARIAPTTPGRALCSIAGAPPVEFQAAHVAGPPPAPASSGVRVRGLRHGRPVVRHPGGRETDAPEAGHEDAASTRADTELAALVQYARDAAAQLDVPAPRGVWLPPLPDCVPSAGRPQGAGAGTLALGLADRPARQVQEPFVVDLGAPGHWSFVGASGSGRTSALLGLASVATAAMPPSALHLYAVSGGSLSPVSDLPHCGAHVTWDDLPRLHRLLDRLTEELGRRRASLASSGLPTMAAWRAQDLGAPPLVLLLVDDWDLLQGRADEPALGTLTDRLLALVREGEGLGLTAGVAGGRGLLTGRAAAALSHRVLLRQSDAADVLLLGLSPRALPAHQPPGRGVLADGTEVQLAGPPPWRPAADVPGSPGRPPLRVAPVPTRVEVTELGRPGARPIHLGRGGDDGAVLSLDPSTDGRRWLVCGAPRSGVSTALRLLAARAAAGGHEVALVGGPRGVEPPDGVTWCDPLDPRRLVELRQAAPGLVLLVDDADTLVDTPLDPVLREICGLVDRDGGLVVCGADATALAGQYRGPAVEVARHRTGLLLGRCGTLEADLLGVRLPPGGAWPPGRGVLVTRGGPTPVQVADPGPGRPRRR
ncbi:FtsK/SpoIIIE domain-containing protein [Phycicoccus ginsengisoli]